MDIRYFYQNNKPSYQHQAIIDKFAVAASQVIELPSLIEVCIYDLGNSVYGGIDMLKINRIGINYNIPFNEIPRILIHELIHVHQKHKGFLRITRNKSCYWHGIMITNKMPEEMSYQEYINLPWELDVANKEKKIMQEVLSILDKN